MTSDRTMTRNVSIAIPTYNRARLLVGTLASLRRLELPPGVEAEIVVIDNNCTDHTAAVVEEAMPQSPLPIRRVVETRQGLCYGRNRALEEARYEHVIYLDDDIEVAPDWLFGYFEAIDVLQADCVVGPVAPKFEIPPPPYMSQRVIDSVSSSYSRKGDAMVLLPSEVGHEVPGCNFGVRKAVGLEIGGFDNELDRIGKGLLAGGDFDFGHRLVCAGKRVVYQPRCWIKHVITAEKLSKPYLRRRWYGSGATTRVMERRRGVRKPLRRRARQAAGALRLWVRAGWAALLKPEPVAFQCELEARQAWAHIFGRAG